MSSEKHPNLQLNKWTPSDYVKMAEFNENFKKIDDKAKEITDAKTDYDGVAHADLPERLTADFGKVTSQLADTIKLSNFPRINGETDDTARLQRAFDYAKSSKKKIVNNDASLIFDISSPLYVDDGTRIDLGNARLRKTTNTLGVGSNTIGVVTDSYAVDAFIIIRHANDANPLFIEITNVQGISTAPTRHQYGIFAPRLARSEMENIWFLYGTVEYAVYGYQWWIIPRFKNIRCDDGIRTWVLANDGSGIGQSTSIHAEQIGGTNQDGCFSLFGVSYSQIDIPFIDECNGVAYIFNSCRGTTVNSPSSELLNSGKFILVSDSNVVVNTPNAIGIKGSITAETYMIDVRDSGNLIINNGRFEGYTVGTPALNFPISCINNSICTLNQTGIPANGNSYLGLTNNSVVVITGSNGSYISKLNGSSEIKQSDGKTKIGYGTSLPVDGTWDKGDLFRITGETYGLPTEYICDTSGTPGTWKMSSYIINKNPTYGRPAGMSAREIGLIYLDTTLAPDGKPIFWNGTAWVDATGIVV